MNIGVLYIVCTAFGSCVPQREEGRRVVLYFHQSSSSSREVELLWSCLEKQPLSRIKCFFTEVDYNCDFEDLSEAHFFL
jgi:hypothetical protein